MTYYIQQIASTSNDVNYWTYITDSNGVEFTTVDPVVLEAKMLEIMQTIPKSKLEVIVRVGITDDLTIAPIV